MRNLLWVIIIACVMGCSHKSVTTRVVPEILSVQHNAQRNEYEVCHPSIGAWKCEQISIKTPFEYPKEVSSFDAECLDKEYTYGSFAGPLIDIVSYKNHGQYFLTKSQEQRLKGIAKEYAGRPLLILGFTDGDGDSKTNLNVATQRAKQVSLSLQRHGVRSDLITIEGQASRCLVSGINNRRSIIFGF